MPEMTFTMIKPDHFGFAYEILSILDRHGSRLMTAEVLKVPRGVIQEHYSPHKDKPFFGYMTESFVGRSVVLAVYEGDAVVSRFITVIGVTDPAKASKDTIREKYSDDSLEKAIAEKRPVKNVIHRSDSYEEAIREIGVWQRYLH